MTHLLQILRLAFRACATLLGSNRAPAKLARCGGRLRAGYMAGLLAVGAASAQDLTVAQIGPFTGLPSPDAAEINAGAQALFDSVNATGGIGGRNIKLMKFDDGFTAPGFIAQFKVAMEAGPIALLSPIGSAAISKMMQDGLLDSTDVIVMNAIPGSEQFRNPGHPKLFHVRAGDRAQLERILGHAKVLSVNEMHVLHQDLPIGTGGLATVQDLAGRIGGMKVTSTGTKHDPEALTVAARDAAKVPISSSVIVIGTPKFCADAIAKWRSGGGRHQIYTLSYVPAGLLTKVVGEAGARGVGIAQTFPSPQGSKLKLQREFQQTMQQYAPNIKDYSYFHLEGYVSARVLVAGLRRAGARPTASTLRAALKDMGEISVGGFNVDFRKGNVGSSWVDIAVVSEGGRLRY